MKAVRWWMISLLMLGAIINYLTRSTLAVAAPTVLKDLGSTNGSRVNGEWVTAPVTLFDGDIVQFGNVRLRYAAAINEDGAA